jgi:hypothetical protein
MNVNCQWIETNLEALFCDTLTEDENRLARAHIETCPACLKEAQALNAIDPLIKTYFRRELEIARHPRFLHKGRVFGIGGVAGAAIVVLLLVMVRTPQPTPLLPSVAVTPTAAPVASANTPSPIKENDSEEVQRAKPSPETSTPADTRPRPVSVIGPNAPEFLVTDPAGYSHTLDEYRGHVLVIGVWNRKQPDSIANIERLYKANADNPKLRFLGVSADSRAKPPNTTFPVVYNEGSKILGAKPGEFVLVDENGAVELRGSLVREFDSLTQALRRK